MTTAATREVAEAVAFELVRAERTKRWLSDNTGIPYSTLQRKLGGFVDFTFSELLLIAKALGVKPSRFIPSEFVDQAVA